MLAGVRTDDRAYVRGPIPELYDLVADPGELRNVHGERPDEARELDGRVGAVLAQERDARPSEIAEADVEALRALGYVVDSEVAQPTGADPKERLEAWNRVNEMRDWLAHGRFAEVIEGVGGILDQDPGNREARLLLGEALVKVGRPEEGIAQFRMLTDRGWFLSRSGALFARTLAEAGYPEESEALLRSFEEREPEMAEHPFNLGVLLQSLGRMDEAREAFERAHRLNPEGVHILSNLAMALAETRGDDPAAAARALELIDRAIRYAESDERPRLIRGGILRRLGRLEEARAAAAELAARPALHDVTAAEVADLLRSVQRDEAASH
jgi:tetratricopeptide (TPR) repeat protein